MLKDEFFNLVIYGYGSHGKRIKKLVDKILYNKVNYSVYGICKTQKCNNEIEIFKNLDELKSKIKNVNCVFIATPNENHLDAFKNCIRNKVPYIYVEKPGNNIEIFCENNINQIKKNLKYIQVGYHLNYENGFVELKNIILNKKFGNLLRLDCFSGKGTAFKKDFVNSWRSKSKESIVQTVMSHLVNLAINLEDKSEFMTELAFVKKSDENGFYDSCHLVGTFNNKSIYSMTASWGAPLKNLVKAYFSNCIWTYDFELGEIITEFPRDNFDKNGYFLSPKSNVKKVDLNGLENSVKNFIQISLKNTASNYEFNQSNLTAKILEEFKYF